MLCRLVYRKAAAWFWTNAEQKFLCFEDSAYILVSRSAEVSFCCKKKIYHFNNTNLQLSTAPLSYPCCSPAVNGKSYLARTAFQYCQGWRWAVCGVGAQTVWETADTQNIYLIGWRLTHWTQNDIQVCRVCERRDWLSIRTRVKQQVSLCTRGCSRQKGGRCVGFHSLKPIRVSCFSQA